MRDFDIRRVLRREIGYRYDGDPDTLIVEELGLCQGVARVDLAVINGSVHGYEIKSEHDTLARLPSQTHVYNRVLDFATIVTAPMHADKVADIVPSWWGVSIVVSREGALQLVSKRAPRRNRDIDSFAFAQLLWRDEALEVLSERGMAGGMKSRRREYLWKRLANDLSLDELGSIVRERLRRRGPNWRVPAPPT